MPLPVPNLDDLRFQSDLVDEARRRIIRYCPEWTDYNLSDPGITLIELFAYMTEMLVYRLNRVPERSYLKFLEMLGFQIQPASSARSELTFYLSTPLPISPGDDTSALVPQGLEVSTRPSEEEPEVIFTVDEKLLISPPRLVQLRKEDDVNRNYLSRLGIEPFHVFSRPKPEPGDTFYLGFDEAQDLRGFILRLTFESEQTRAVGVRREDPPWVWECSTGSGQWEEVPPSSRAGEKDTTGGLNNERGALTLYLPLSMRPNEVHGHSANWVRCRLEQRDPEQGMYTESPRVLGIRAYALGATTRATHAVVVPEEHLGFSDGEPDQVFRLRNTPVLAFREDETVEVEERRGHEIVYIPWQRVPSFSQSERYDRHFTLDEATGEIRFGPGVRQPDGSVRQYGRVPEAGRRIRVTSYRYGGGVAGNVPAGRIQVLRSAVPYVSRVVNLARAEGGRDQESLEEIQLRARRELRAQNRAVTAEDYEQLSLGAGRDVARAKCLASSNGERALPPGMIEVLVVPAAFDALRARDLSRLHLAEPLREKVRAHLDNYRLLTTTLRIREPNYLGIQASVEIVVSEFSNPESVIAQVDESLRMLLSPLDIRAAPGRAQGQGPGLGGRDERESIARSSALMGPNWQGWPFGRDLYVSEIYSQVQQVPGVEHVMEVGLGYRKVLPYEESRSPSDDEAAQQSLTPITDRRFSVPDDTLLCSLDHRIRVVEL